MFLLDKNSLKTVESLLNLRKISSESLRLSLYSVGDDIKKEIRRLILDPPKSGRMYRLRLKGVSVLHQASAPGEPPANFTGDLRNTISYKVKGFNELRIEAGSQKVDYAGALEFGNGKIEPRPYIDPAIRKSTRNISTRISNYMTRRLRKLT